MPIRFASLLVSPQLCVSISAYFRELLSSQNEEANTDDDDGGGSYTVHRWITLREIPAQGEKIFI